MMNDADQQPADSADDDDVQIVDLDHPGSPQHRRVTRFIGLARKSLATPWVRYSLSASLLLILLGALFLQLLRPMPPTASTSPKTPPPLFLSATIIAGLIFIQSTDHTLTAFQSTTGHVRWHIRLPAVSAILAGGQALYCFSRTTPGHTELEALAASTGKLLWHDALPAVTASTTTGQFEVNGANISLAPAFSYSNNALYFLSSSGTVYAIQANTGHITWTYEARDAQAQSTPTPQPGSFPTQDIPLVVRNGVVQFAEAHSMFHFLNATTGQQFLSLPFDTNALFPFIDGQTIYLLPFLGAPSASIQAFHIPDGRLLWMYQLPSDISVQAEMDGMIYLSSAAGSTLIALRGSDGHQLWAYHSSDGQPATTTFVAKNGIGYLIQHDATVVGIRVSDGQVLWHTQLAALKNLQTIGFFSLDQGNLVLSSQDPHNLSAMAVYILRASDGHLLWHGPDESITSSPIALNGTFYAWQNNGQLDAWRESDGQHLWGYSAPIGSSMVRHLPQGSPLLFLFDPVGTFYILRSSDGKLLWRYPLPAYIPVQGQPASALYPPSFPYSP